MMDITQAGGKECAPHKTTYLFSCPMGGTEHPDEGTNAVHSGRKSECIDILSHCKLTG